MNGYQVVLIIVAYHVVEALITPIVRRFFP